MATDAEGNEQQTAEPEHIKTLRTKAENHDKVQAENRRLQAELAFTRAGYDVEHPLAKRLMEGYDGDLTADAIRKHVGDMGVAAVLAIKPPESESTTTSTTGAETTATAEEQAQTQARTDAIEAGQHIPPGTPNPVREALAAGFDILDAGGSREEAMGAFQQKVFAAAVAGDQRVLTENKGGERLDNL